MATTMLAVVIAVQALSIHHVRTTEPKIVSLVEAGMSRSATFQRLVDALDGSDVIVYVEPKQTRQALGGYLAHTIVSQGGYRHLHVAVDTRGSERRLVALLAHELQHALEVAQDPTARNAEDLDRLFSRLAIPFGCGGTTCAETQAAKDVEAAVSDELGRSR
jgi:hypothetical protein